MRWGRKWGLGESLFQMARKTKMKKKRKYRKHPVEVFIEFAILVFLIPIFFSLGILVGCGYLFAFFGSIWRGTFFKKKNVARLIVVGSVLTYFAGLALKYALIQHDWIIFSVIMVIAAYVWYRGFRLKRKGSLQRA